jgi:hypothetical protein
MRGKRQSTAYSYSLLYMQKLNYIIVIALILVEAA